MGEIRMTEKELSREVMLADTVAERGRQVLQQSQQIAQLERERDSLLARIRELESKSEAGNISPPASASEQL